MDLSKISDMKLVGRAVKDRWPVSDEMRKRIVDSLMTVLVTGEPREIVAATRVLASIDKMNVDLQNAAEQMDIEELKIELAFRLAQQKAVIEAKETLGLEDEQE
jgi:hypothetical protein